MRKMSGMMSTTTDDVNAKTPWRKDAEKIENVLAAYKRKCKFQ